MNVLDQIVAHKREEVAARAARVPLAALRKVTRRAPLADFTAAMRSPGVSAIAEIKRRSPSKGTLCESVDVAALAQEYQRHGAAALSVLTDAAFFGGSDEDLKTARRACGVPILRKDFTIDAYQIHEASAIGASAILLIVRILRDVQIREFLALASELGLSALVEVHDDDELKRAADCGATLFGINNRDLDTFEVNLETCLRLRGRVPPGCIAVAESAIHSRADVIRLEHARFDGMLIGEALMRSSSPGQMLEFLLEDAR